MKAAIALLRSHEPRLTQHLDKENVTVAILGKWMKQLFINSFPVDFVRIVWDGIMCEGLVTIVKVAVACLSGVSDFLVQLKEQEILKYFDMMRTYEDDEGELSTCQIARLAMMLSEKYVIGKDVLLNHRGLMGS